ncbi:MAG: tandem-95 repeat protein, partial [Bacteroidota bacterium]
MRELYLKITLLAMLLMSFGNYLSAQVTFDNNEQTVVGGFITPPTINNFTVPAGTDRLLVVVFSTANSSFSTTTTFPQVDFGTNTLTGGQEQVQNFNRATKTYFLPLGTGAATSNDITLSSTVSGAEFRVLTAFSLQFVNQTTPVEASVGQQPPDNGTTNSIIVPNTTNGSLIVENLLFSAGFPFVSATPQSGQNIIDSREESSGNRIRTSLVTTSGGDVTITWEIDPSINRGANTAMSFDFSGVLLNKGNEMVTTNEDIAVTTPNVLTNNVDGVNNIGIPTPPTTSSQGGTVSFNAGDSTFIYTPALNFNGQDTIIYTVCDDVMPMPNCVQDSVFITVVPQNDPPTQGNENLTLNEDDPTTATPNVLANNMDVDGDPVTVTSPPTTSSQGATISFNTADSTFNYTPIANFCGMDSIFYMVCDDSNVCMNDTVFINVICVNDPPNQGN